MKNRIAYTAERPSTDALLALNVSLLVAEHFRAKEATLLADPYTELSKLIRAQIPQSCSRVFLSNFGILIEPELGLAADRFLLDLAIDYELILHWEGAIVSGRKLIWDPQVPTVAIEFAGNILYQMEMNE